MRIAMLAPRPQVRGPLPKHTPLLVEALRHRGCEVEVLPWGRRSEDESLLAKLLGRAGDVVNARRRVTRGDYPLVVVKTAHDWSTLARDVVLVRALAGRDRVIVLQLHGSQSGRLTTPGSRLFKRATTALLDSVDGLLVLSREERAEWQAFSPDTRVLVVRNPRAASIEIASNDEAGRPMILCVSRLIAAKGVLDLVRALPRVNRQIPCRVVLAGDGPDAARVRTLAAELGVLDSVELPGYLNDGRLASLYRVADVFALPTYWDEGFPTVILEAMAAGLPIVTTRSRGSADHLVDGTHALFVPPRDPTALAATLARLLRDPQLRRRMAAANREKAREFDPEPVAVEYLSALEEIVAAVE
jgi:glycosyltransferase involved in cell wall biosynthesis